MRNQAFSLTSKSVELKLTGKGLVLYFSTFLASLVSYCLFDSIGVFSNVYAWQKRECLSVFYYEGEPLFRLLISKTSYNGIRKNIIIATPYSLSELECFMKFKGFKTCEWQVNLLDIVDEI